MYIGIKSSVNALLSFLPVVVILFVLNGCMQNGSIIRQVLSADDDTVKIKELLSGKPKSMLNYRDEESGETLLASVVEARHYHAAQVLAELGADPNIQSKNGQSAFIIAAQNTDSSAYLKLLLKYGGDVNAVAKSDEYDTYWDKTPLIAAIAAGSLENVKLLVEAGANVNYACVSEDGLNVTAVNVSAMKAAAGVGEELWVRILRYLIVDKKANYRKGYTTVHGSKDDTIYVADLLHKLRCDSGSDEYKIKMDIVKYMKDRD